MKRAWQDKSADEISAWYQKRYQDGRGAKGQKREYEVEQEEVDEKGKYIDLMKRVMYEPYDIFEDRYLGMNKSVAWIENKWKEKLNDCTTPRKKVNGMTLVGRFLGTPLQCDMLGCSCVLLLM